MNKQEFLKALSERLDKLPENEKNKSINYYLEMIDDRIEEGASEDEAIDALGGIEDIAENIMSQYPDVNKKQSIKKRFNLNTVTIILLIIGSPIWLSILLAIISVIISIYSAAFGIAVALVSIVISFILGGIFAVVASPVIMFQNLLAGIFALGSGLTLVGLGILAVFGSILFIRLIIKATKFFIRKIAYITSGKERFAQ